MNEKSINVEIKDAHLESVAGGEPVIVPKYTTICVRCRATFTVRDLKQGDYIKCPKCGTERLLLRG